MKEQITERQARLSVLAELSSAPGLGLLVRQHAERAERRGRWDFPATSMWEDGDERAVAELETSSTPYGDVVEILQNGAKSDEATVLIEDLLLLSSRSVFPSSPEQELAATRLVVAFDRVKGTRLLPSLIEIVEAGGPALSASLGRIARGEHEPESMGSSPGQAERLYAAGCLREWGTTAAWSALERARPLATSPALAALCAAASASGAVPPSEESSAVRDDQQARTFLEGELGPTPRGPVSTALLALTLWLFVSRALRLLGRVALGYRTPARLRVTEEGLELQSKTMVLGRTLRDESVVVPLPALSQVIRETRFARAGLYAGLVCLVVGTYVGLGLVFDGARAPGGSPSLVATGLALITGGLLLDFALTSLVDGVRSKSRVVVAPRQGRAWAIGGVDPVTADAMLRALQSAHADHSRN